MKSNAAKYSKKSPLPATGPASPSVSSPSPVGQPLAPKSTRVPRVKTPAPAAAPAQVQAAPAAPAAPATQPSTIITAKVDVGFGNAVYLRGDGPGLSWNKGLPLTCVSSDTWTIAISGAEKPIVFKFLSNDETWSKGEDFVAAPGTSTEFAPTF